MDVVEELLAKAKKPALDAMKLHHFYQGKIQIALKCAIRSFNDFAIWYTPGVAEPCKAIKTNKELSYEYTNRANTIAVVSDGTRVLGLGDIGPEAGMPVMEGKSLLFKYLGGVDAIPICLDTKDPEEIIKVVKYLQPNFGGINLEDISQPKCFYILERLRNEMDIPVWHDDQQGTATVVVAGLINALKLVGKDIRQAKVVILGAGASGICTARVLIMAGVKAGNIIMLDSQGILHPGRENLQKEYKEKWEMCLKTNKEGRSGDLAEALVGMDTVVGLSRPGPGVIKKEWVTTMSKDAIVFACANPIPEIWPWEAKEAGARVVATGRSDFDNQVNNSLGFPAIFRGALDVRAKTISDEMCLAAAFELARFAEEKGLTDTCILPRMDDPDVFPQVAVVVALKAIEQGLHRIELSKELLYDKAVKMIKGAQEMTALLMKEGFIPEAPAE
ncbi:MAG: NAD-dependent malic enzyme [candidate division WS2 bacterium]|uniref:NAD-dependent malic enzyme n=1 Tax=Psychracetigena formicireducens TaxID=2986056 RepID=A0A9E2F0J5_PSYF1|nr:NAD-dependent malic enzyme [Candidatus Psychracetigena formicireducens]MBT9144419.1 NAD-dependent malic enzyme [Candidatus Psychracetigena formicireducens]MBT9150389.1 NAD-dependent malic enzyme [Candidatus Psychracetigena formicireducens]